MCKDKGIIFWEICLFSGGNLNENIDAIHLLAKKKQKCKKAVLLGLPYVSDNFLALPAVFPFISERKQLNFVTSQRGFLHICKKKLNQTESY